MKSIALLVLFIACSVVAFAQHDSSYYETFRDKLTARVYVSQKFLKFSIPASGEATDAEYKANTNMNLGVGVTWHNISANIFYGVKFLNKDDEKGETKGLDLQFHVYPKKWAIDLLALFPKGYYMYPKGYASSNGNSYYYRPDLRLSYAGLSVLRVPNKEKFSYRAAIVQNEWQKKSAGSLLYGGEIYYGRMKGDSSMIPKKIEGSFAQAGMNQFNFISFGPCLGYAYTLVIDKHFFVSASVAGSLDINLSTEKTGDESRKKTSVSPAAVYKGAIGYNSSNWSLTANACGNALLIKGSASPKNYFIPAGVYRIALAKKIKL
ncbi:MAG TPA: DUF4421 domain-containing protein [Chitinophagaceae bacterium]